MEPKSRIHPDLKNLCHCCLIRAKHKDLKRCYRRNNQLEVFSDMLNECFEILLWAREEGEGGICEICLKKLRDALDFKRQVLSCQQQLQDAVKEEEEPEIKQEVLDLDIDFGPLDDDVKTEPLDPEEQDKETEDKKAPDIMSGTSRIGDVSVRRTRELDMVSEGDNDEVKMEQDRYVAQDSYGEQTSFDESGSASIPRTAGAPVATVKTRTDRAKTRTSATKKPVIAEKKITKKSPKKAPVLASIASASSEAFRSLNASTIPSILESELTKKSPKTKAVVRPNRASASAEAVRAHEANVRTLIQHSNCTPFLTRTIAGIQCCHCQANFLTLTLLKEHMQSAHTNYKYCGRNSISNTNLSCKMDITDLKCKLCEQNFDLLPGLKDHLAKEHGVKFVHEEKNYIFVFRLNDGVGMDCALCSATFETFKTLLEHMNRHYRNFVCKECDVGFINEHKLFAHQKIHRMGTFQCSFCPKVFPTAVRRTGHENRFHKKVARRSIKCPLCEMMFTSYHIRNRHVLEDHGSTAASYKCNICDKIYAMKTKLSNHVRDVHLMERNHKCLECGLDFFRKFSLEQHMVRHTGEKIHKCTECDKAYARKKTLIDHMRIHSNDRRFSCELCCKAYVHRSSLKDHMLVAHGALAKFEKAKLASHA